MNPLPFNQQQNPTDYYKRSMFQKVDTTNQPYFERPYITIPKNNQKSFAQFLYPNPSTCRDTGYLCNVMESSNRVLNRDIFMEKDKYNLTMSQINGLSQS